MYNTAPVKKPFPLTAVIYAAYGVLSFGFMFFNAIGSMIAYDYFDIEYFISHFKADQILISLGFIALGVFLFIMKENPLPPVIVNGAVLVISFIAGSIKNISFIGDLIEYTYMDYVIIDLMYMAARGFCTLAFALMTLFCVLSMLFNKKYKKCGILSLWFIPAAAYALGLGTEFLADIITVFGLYYHTTFWSVTVMLLSAGLRLVLVAAMVFHCLDIKKANQLASEAIPQYGYPTV